MNSFQKAPSYRMLETGLMKPEEREKAASLSAFIRTKKDAEAIAGKEEITLQQLDSFGRVYVVLWHGIEIVILFRRRTVEITMEASDPVPEKSQRIPDEWLPIDLLNPDEPAVVKGVADRLRRALEEEERLKGLLNLEKQRANLLKEDLKKCLESKKAELESVK